MDIDLGMSKDQLKSIKVHTDIPEGKELESWARLSEVFKDGAVDEHLHIIVGPPAGTHYC